MKGKTTAAKLLCEWIRLVIYKDPKNNVDKIVHREIILAQTESGDFSLVGIS